jgi:hypothetical protein
MEIEKSLQTTLKKCGLFPVDDTSIMQAGLIKPTITVIYSVPKRTHEKNGAT